MTPRTILAIGYAAFVVYAYPGNLAWDSTNHLIEARSGEFTDWHPATIPALWWLCERVIAGPVLMLVIGSLPFLIGTYLVLGRAMSPRAAAITSSLILLFPPVGTVMAVVWKDSLMASFLMIGFAAILAERRRIRWLGLVAIAAGSAMRYNALAATFAPILLLYRFRDDIAGWRRYAIAVGAWIAVTGAGIAANQALTDRSVHLWHQSLALQDIAGTIHHAGGMTDDDLRAILAGTPLVVERDIQAAVDRTFKPSDYQHLVHGPDRLFDRPDTAAERAAIARAWWQSVSSHPGAYAAYRWGVFTHVLNLQRARGPNAYVWAIAVGAYDSQRWIQHSAASSRAQHWLRQAMFDFSHTWVFFPFWYFGLLLVLLPLCRDRVTLAVLGSGLGYELALVVLAPTSDFRYSQWMIAMVAMAACSVFAVRYRRGRAT
jgi:hypothetical protein